MSLKKDMKRGSGFIFYVLLIHLCNDWRKERESGKLVLRNRLVNETEVCCGSFTSE